MANGQARRGQLVALYPGLVYRSSIDPIFWCSLNNHYIIQISNKYFIDGKSTGLSGLMYKSIVRSNSAILDQPVADLDWIQVDYQLTPLYIGQIANNANTDQDSNGKYIECSFIIS